MMGFGGINFGMGGVCVVNGGDCVVVADGLWQWLFFSPGGCGLVECGCGCGSGWVL